EQFRQTRDRVLSIGQRRRLVERNGVNMAQEVCHQLGAVGGELARPLNELHDEERLRALSVKEQWTWHRHSCSMQVRQELELAACRHLPWALPGGGAGFTDDDPMCSTTRYGEVESGHPGGHAACQRLMPEHG